MAELRPERKIIIIPAKKESPQEQAKKRNLRVAAYCRVSTGDEEQLTSYENQKAFYTEKIMKNPDWTMVDIFADEGITGTSTCRRKQFLRMIRQCRQGKIDMILAKSVSRFARNTLDTISYTRELRSLGIAVIFEEQNINSIHPESEFLIALHAAFAQSESESISANVRWGKRQSIKDGKVTFQYKTMLGYIWWGTMPRIINTFLDTYDLSGKTVLPFCTSGSSGITQSVTDIRAAEPDADVRDGLRASGANDSSIENWIADNGISE